METFAKLFARFLVFVYHCFDRIVIHGYLSSLSRPEQVVYFVHHVLGIPVVSKEVLSRRTEEYRGWVEAYARNHIIPMEWAEKGLRKEDHADDYRVCIRKLPLTLPTLRSKLSARRPTLVQRFPRQGLRIYRLFGQEPARLPFVNCD